MMRIKNLYIVLFAISLFIASSAFAQVPGYMGKKVHLQGGIKFFPSFINPVNLMQAQPIPYVVPGMNYRLELGMDVMVSRKSSLGFNTHYYNTATRMEYFVSTTGDNRVAIEGGGIGLVFKTHFGGWIAPLGFYYRLETGAIIYNVNDPVNNFGGTFINTTGATGYINNAFGRTHIFANRISLDYGVEIGFAFPPYDFTVTGTVNTRFATQNLANVYIKIGGIF